MKNFFNFIKVFDSMNKILVKICVLMDYFFYVVDLDKVWIIVIFFYWRLLWLVNIMLFC